MSNVLYVGMMYDITSLINLENSVDNIYVIDMVDLCYGQFIKDKKNSWETLKEKIKNIIKDGYNINNYDNTKQINKLGKAEIIFEEDIIKDTEHAENTNKYDVVLTVKHRWTLKFRYENTGKEINMIFYAGYCSEDIWELDIQNINCVMSMGSYFYGKLNDRVNRKNYDINTKNMIIERCILPLSHYKLYYNCKKKYHTKISKKSNNLQEVEINDDIGKIILTDFSNRSLQKLLTSF